MSDVVYVISVKADNGDGSTITQAFEITVTSATPPPLTGKPLLADGTSNPLLADGTSKPLL